MDILSSKALVAGLGVVIIAIASLCSVAAHHTAGMPNMSQGCGTSYFLAALPQPLQGRGALFALLGLLVLAVAYPIGEIHASGSASGTSRPISPPRERVWRHDPFVELFRTGILNPKVFDPAFVRG